MRFKSITNSDLAYTWQESIDFLAEQCRHGRPLSAHCGSFLTYGDGAVQHSHESAVQIDGAADYLLSLARHLAEKPADVGLIADRWPRGIDGRDIAFGATVRHKETKLQWYSLDDRKVSSAAAKRHDKRWNQVEAWHDGGFASVMAVACPPYLDGLGRVAVAGQVADFFSAADLWVDRKQKATCIGLESVDEIDLLLRVFDYVDSIVKAFKLVEYAHRASEQCVENMRRRKLSAVPA